MNVLKSAAQGYGTERRIILLHGPVGSAKSTIARQLKKGIEEYSRTHRRRALHVLLDAAGRAARARRRQRGVPLADARRAAAADPARVARRRRSTSSSSATTTSSVKVDGDVNPACRLHLQGADAPLRRQLREGDDARARAPPRALASRTASASARSSPRTRRTRTRPSSPATSTTARSPTFGSDSDPRAFNFDGEFNIANRGILEFVEILKLDVAFLYDLLGATQERKIKPKKFAQTDIDEVIIGHTNEAEYKKLLNNEFMEALRDRTVKVDIPYITKVTEEVKIYTKDFTTSEGRQAHRAAHAVRRRAVGGADAPRGSEEALAVAAPEGEALRRQDAAGLHRRTTSRSCARKPTARASTASRRATSRTRSRTRWSATRRDGAINPFMVLNELESGLRSHSLINSDEQRKRYARDALGREAGVRGHRQERGPARDQRRRGHDRASCARNYIDNIKAYTQKEKVKNPYTGQDEEPDERLMRSIEEKIDIPESRKDDFRREIMNYIGALAIEGRTFDYKTNERLHKALEAQAVRGPEGLDQADVAGVERRRPRHAGEDRRRQAAPDQELRLRRGLARPTC